MYVSVCMLAGAHKLLFLFHVMKSSGTSYIVDRDNQNLSIMQELLYSPQLIYFNRAVS